MTPSAIMTLIITLTARAWDVPVRVMRAEGRPQQWVQARHVAMMLVRSMTCASLPRIGRAFDRDHSSVFHGIEGIIRAAASDPILHARIEAVRAQVQAAMNAASDQPEPGATAIPSGVCPWASRDTVRKVVRLRGEGMMPGTIASRMGVSPAIVNAVLRETERTST